MCSSQVTDFLVPHSTFIFTLNFCLKVESQQILQGKILSKVPSGLKVRLFGDTKYYLLHCLPLHCVDIGSIQVPYCED